MQYLHLPFLILCLLIASFCPKAYCQNPYPTGVYMSLAEIRQKKPSRQYPLVIEQRTLRQIASHGGNDYQIVALTDSVKKRIIKKKIWAVSDSSGLYINGSKIKSQDWYAKVDSLTDSTLFFSGALPNSILMPKVITLGIVWGLIGGVIGAGIAAYIVLSNHYGIRCDYQLALYDGTLEMIRMEEW